MQSPLNTVQWTLTHTIVCFCYSNIWHEVEINQLTFTTHQKALTHQVYALQKEVSLVFSDHSESQREAQDILNSHQLDHHSCAQLENQWNIQWSGAWNIGKSDDKWCRILLQWYVTVFELIKQLLFDSSLYSSSGFNSESRQTKYCESNHEHSLSGPGPHCNPYDSTGCVAHAKITKPDSDGQLTRIVGILDHNKGCQSTQIAHLPSIPLHPHVYEVAHNQLHSGTR